MSNSNYINSHHNQPYEEVYSKAIKQNKDYYKDPETGYLVFTDLYHLKRGNCCGNRCRHCPFNYINVKKKKEKME
ncbi:hypothetical protein K502DRAFT_365355 [Neoconidiobolus thromboides FSU 785]|nr:hypothetical protein K502DRAFT_365355 [Neoconidiobolus thromboides FSU 785]